MIADLSLGTPTFSWHNQELHSCVIFGDTHLLNVTFLLGVKKVIWVHIKGPGAERGIDDESEAPGVKAYQNSE